MRFVQNEKWRVMLTLLALLLMSARAVFAPDSQIRGPAGFQVAGVEVLADDPVVLLSEVKSLLIGITPPLRGFHRTRMKMINLYVEKVLIALENPQLGLGHKETLEAFMDLINALDAAESYFRTLSDNFSRDNVMTDSLARVVQIKNDLAKAYGFDRSTYTLNINRLLSQMKVLFDELAKQQIPDALQKKLNQMIPTLGFAVATSAAGDRPKAFKAAEPIALEVKKLYENFNALSSAKDAFNTALMIQFLNERLLDYGQYE